MEAFYLANNINPKSSWALVYPEQNYLNTTMNNYSKGS